MAILPISAFKDNYIWAIIDQQAQMFDCIDPGDAQPVLDFAKTHNLSLSNILLTHHHPDHIGGVRELRKAYPDCQVYGPSDPRIPDITHTAKPNQLLTIGQNHFTVLFNPGHTSTHISYYEPQQAWLFCGDTLFSAGCGRVFDGTMEQLHDSIKMFSQLPSDTQVYCGHEYTKQNLRFALAVEPANQDILHYAKSLEQSPQSCTLPSTIQREHTINPFFRTTEAAVIQYALAKGAQSTSSMDVFRALREQKDSFI